MQRKCLQRQRQVIMLLVSSTSTISSGQRLFSLLLKSLTHQLSSVFQRVQVSICAAIRQLQVWLTVCSRNSTSLFLLLFTLTTAATKVLRSASRLVSAQLCSMVLTIQSLRISKRQRNSLLSAMRRDSASRQKLVLSVVKKTALSVWVSVQTLTSASRLLTSA